MTMKALKRLGFVVSLAVAVVAAGTLSAQAQVHHDHHDHHHPAPPHGHPPGPPHGIYHHGGPHGFVGRGHYHPYRFHHDFAHFTPYEMGLWRHGHWYHSWHDGRYGWWWAVNGLWYFYAAPIYPFPGYVSSYYWMPPVAPAPVYAPGFWYYCSATGGYYPNVPTCPVPWTPVRPGP
jgi:hypothetical protein